MPHITFSDEQHMIRDSARRFLADACPPSLVRAAHADPEAAWRPLWKAMADLQWTGLMLPERYNGAGAGFLTLCILLEEMGRVCLPGPFFSSAVLGGLSLLRFAEDRHREVLLPRLAAGEILVTLAIQEGASEFDHASFALSARPAGAGYELNGAKLFVPDAASADSLIVVARAEGVPDAFNLLLAPRSHPGVTCTPVHTIGGRHLCTVTCRSARLGPDALLNPRPIVWVDLQDMLGQAAVAKSAEMVGGAQRAMDLALEYAKSRRQFGKAIGSFQAIQHHCVNMLVLVESARWFTYRCAAAIDAGERDLTHVAMAKAWNNQCYREVVRLAHQVMGGIGYIEDHAMPLYTRHARQTEATLGDSDTLLDIVAAELLDSGRWAKRETVLV